MSEHDKFAEDLNNLENLLVRQFRSIETMIELTRKEREEMLSGKTDQLMQIVEDKEALLDQLGLLEDGRRDLIQRLALSFQVRSDTTSIKDLLPYLSAEESQRIIRMEEGISALAARARELNHGNQALAFSNMDWLQQAQAFMISLAQPEIGYRPPGSAAGPNDTLSSGVQYRV